MKKSILALVTAAMIGLFAQGGTAHAFLLGDRSPNVTAGQIIAGGGMTVAYFGLTCKHNFSHCARFDSARSLKWYGLTTVGCMALAPIVGTIVVQRELTMREAYVMTADCVIPFVGGWLMSQAFDAHPEWEGKGKVRRARR